MTLDTEIESDLTRDFGETKSFSPNEPAPPPTDKVNILLVDDRPDKLLALEAALTDLGQNLVKAKSGKEALRHLLQMDFCVVLLDVSMPGMDGFETAALLRQRMQSEHTPIIFVTSHNDSANHIAKGYSLGAVDFISSPVVPQVLRTKVSVFVELHKKTAQVKQQAKQLLQAKQAEHRQRLRSVLEACPDIVFVVSPNRTIDFTNPAAETFARSVGMTDHFPAALQAQVEQVSSTGQNLLPNTFQGVHRFRVANEERYFLPRMVTMGGKEKPPHGVTVMLHDVTEFRLLDEIKTNLIATVSHELKTPLTSISTALLMLRDHFPGSPNPKRKELIEIACQESERMLRTLDTLLDLTRFEEGLPGMSFELAPPESLMESALEDTRRLAATAGVKLLLTMEPDLPLLRVDRERIIHSLSNLLTNAIKHSPEGGEIQVVIRCQDDDRVRFSVADQGPGVPMEFQSRIFEKFFRVPGNPKNGVGLGLTIAREFIRAHGGTIGLQSEPGRGAEFYIVLKKNSLASGA